jgi:hypothetical protein
MCGRPRPRAGERATREAFRCASAGGADRGPRDAAPPDLTAAIAALFEHHSGHTAYKGMSDESDIIVLDVQI